MSYYGNNAIEFVLYFVIGQKFRSAFLDMFGCRNAISGMSRRKSKLSKIENEISMTEIQP